MSVVCSLAGPECTKLRFRTTLVLSEWSRLKTEVLSYVPKQHTFTKKLMSSKFVFIFISVPWSTGECSLTICSGLYIVSSLGKIFSSTSHFYFFSLHLKRVKTFVSGLLLFFSFSFVLFCLTMKVLPCFSQKQHNLILYLFLFWSFYLLLTKFIQVTFCAR